MRKKKLMTVVFCVISVPVTLLVVWMIMSPGKIRSYKEKNSLSEKYVMDINGAPNGFIINSKDIDNPVLLLVSSGPGTDDYFLTDKYKEMNLEEEFTVVYWDYRYMGIAYDGYIDMDSVNIENLLNDTYSVTEYLKDRFNKEKIYIMGFSGGTHIALKEVQRHPEDYYAYIGMAQCVTDSEENDTLMYDFMKSVFEERGDRSSLKKLEAAVDHLDTGNIKCKDWFVYVDLLHKSGGGTIHDKSEFEGIAIPVLLSRCYTIKEKLNYIPSMKKYRETPLYAELENYDYRMSISNIDIPVFFISGEYDYNCPWELVEDYCGILDSPQKSFFKIPDSAHSPLWENSVDSMNAIRQIKEMTYYG